MLLVVNFFSGRVTNIANSSTTATAAGSTDQVTNFEVRILISATSYQEVLKESHKKGSPFLPGMSANVDILTNTLTNVLSVPSQSVTTRTEKKDKENNAQQANNKEKEVKNFDKPKEIVFVYTNGAVKQVEVKTGIADNLYIQIVSGLNAGDEVVSGSYRSISKELKDGMKVKKVTEQELNKSEK